LSSGSFFGFPENSTRVITNSNRSLLHDPRSTTSSLFLRRTFCSLFLVQRRHGTLSRRLVFGYSEPSSCVLAVLGVIVSPTHECGPNQNTTNMRIDSHPDDIHGNSSSTSTTLPLLTSWVAYKQRGKDLYEQGNNYQGALASYAAALHPQFSSTMPVSERQIILSNLVACRLQMGGMAQAHAAIENAKQVRFSLSRTLSRDTTTVVCCLFYMQMVLMYWW
jgi:hypothetical protein